jgi:hypothetical protein
LKLIKAEVTKEFSVKNIGVFGSVARDEQTDQSDIDLLVEFSRPVGFITFMRLEKAGVTAHHFTEAECQALFYSRRQIPLGYLEKFERSIKANQIEHRMEEQGLMALGLDELLHTSRARPCLLYPSRV